MNHHDDFQSNNENTSNRENTIRRFFNSQNLTETRKAIVLNDLVDQSSPDVDYFLLLIFSSGIATFGLIGDLPVVTIGAQLIAPLMMPILSIAISSMVGLRMLFKRSIIAIIKGSLLAIGLSILITFLAYRLPLSIYATVPQEVINRTSVSSLDLGIAIIAGAAAAYAIGNPHLDAALPGVALATSLVPPLCTIGFGITFLSSEIILGAALLFLTNLIAIIFSATLVFALLGFRPGKNIERHDHNRPVIVSAILMAILGIPLIFLAWNTVMSERLHISAKSAIIESLPPDLMSELVDFSIISNPNLIEIRVTAQMVRPISQSELDHLKLVLAESIGQPIKIKFVSLPLMISD